MTHIKILNLKKYYGKKLVLDIDSLDLEKGQSYGFFGANGSGKSTLLKCMTNLVDYKGEIQIENQNLKKNPSILKDIGLIIENPVFYNEMTGRKNIEYFCDDTALLEEYADIMGIKDILDKKYRSYSLGMRQKLGILLACVKGKKAVILDEPFNGLDIISVEKAIKLINHCHNKGVTIILTSHQLDISQKAVDNIYLMKNCRIHKFVLPKNKAGDKILFEFANKGDADKAENFLICQKIKYEREDDMLRVFSQGKYTFYELIDLLKPFEFIKAEDITFSIKELYLEMEKSL